MALMKGVALVAVAVFASAGSSSNAIDAIWGWLRLLFPFVDVVRMDLAWGEPNGGTRFLVGIMLRADKQRDRVR